MYVKGDCHEVTHLLMSTFRLHIQLTEKKQEIAALKDK